MSGAGLLRNYVDYLENYLGEDEPMACLKNFLERQRLSDCKISPEVQFGHFIMYLHSLPNAAPL